MTASLGTSCVQTRALVTAFGPQGNYRRTGCRVAVAVSKMWGSPKLRKGPQSNKLLGIMESEGKVRKGEVVALIMAAV